MIDTEPLWRESQMEIFTHVGIHLSLEDVISTTGIRIDEIVYRRFDEQAWDEKAIMTRDDLTQAIVGRMAVR